MAIGDSNTNSPAPAPGASPRSPPPPVYVPTNGKKATLGPKSVIELAKVVSVTFRGDHAKLKNNTTHWQNAGALYPKPEFIFGVKSQPVSCTRGQKLEVTIELEVYPANLPSRPYLVRGTATFGGLVFELATQLKGGKQPLQLASTQNLPDAICRLSGDITWTIVAPGQSVTADASWGHDIFVTYDVPKDLEAATRQEDGVTVKRMAAAVVWIAPLNTLDPHAIVRGLMKKLPYYVLSKSNKVPAVFNHPSYFNTLGGAWPMYDYAGEYGECQAIVRLTRGMLRQTGVPGETKIFVVWAEPSGADAVVREADWEVNPSAGVDTTRIVGSEEHIATLVDGAVKVGDIYPSSHARLPSGRIGPGFNRYEACLRFTANGVTKYFGGGAGEFDDKEHVILAFWALIWLKYMPNGSLMVVGIAKRF